MTEPAQTSLLYDQPQKPRGSSRYSGNFIKLTGIIGLLSFIAAVALTIIGTAGLRNYGFSNNPLIAGIVLFGVDPSQSIVLYNEIQPTPKKIEKVRSYDKMYSGCFAIISGTLGFLCLIPAIILTLTGAAELGDDNNNRLVAGIVLFGFAITLIILAFLTCCFK
ncbi:unnamed protein product [Adineta steineri]|uniref:Uncharacterized protein n=1 Tax=Adineta steineri TaxID=433720 RepID=A0A815UTJ7_9BILA|nr:unnamed protein product [Adineta steineri]